MSIWFIMLLIALIPVILLPVALVWFINVSGIYSVIKARRRRVSLVHA